MKESDCRPLVRKFAVEMEHQLRENDHKSGRWADIQQLRAKLMEEVLELIYAIDRGDSSTAVIREAADVGNIAAMICGYVDDSWPHVNERS